MARRGLRAAVAEQEEGAVDEREQPSAEDALNDPERQFAILKPKVLTYVLTLPREVQIEKLVDGKRARVVETELLKREIEIPTEFTLGDIVHRRLRDDLLAFGRLVSAEVTRLCPDLRILPATFLGEHMGYLEAALSRSAVRDQLRELVSKLATYKDDKRKKDERPVHPSLEEIEDGMSDSDLTLLGLVLLGRANEESSNRKNGLATAPA